MNIRFIDLFAGIGGFRMGFESVGANCVFSSEIDDHAKLMYYENFGEIPHGDIRNISVQDIPQFDVLLAGFPCQPFSIAGVKKGFDDTRGTLFFDIARIIEYHMPLVVVLENVKHFKNHDHGNTLRIVLRTLESLGYRVSWDLLNAKDFGVPQNRERTLIIATTIGERFRFDNLEHVPEIDLSEILEGEKSSFEYLADIDYTLIDNHKKQDSGLIFIGYRNKNIRKRGVRPNTNHLSRVHKQPNRIYSSAGTHPTLSSQEPTGRYFIYHEGKVRKLTLLECYRLMGFPDDFVKVGSTAKQYNRVGNSIVIPMVKEIAKCIKRQYFSLDYKSSYGSRYKQITML